MLADNPDRTRRWNRRRAEILQVAEALFGERGFASVRLGDVADQMGMQRPSLTYYFRDKADLYDAVFSQITTDLLERIGASRAIENPLARMEAIASMWIDFMVERPQAARILLRYMMDDSPPHRPETAQRGLAMMATLEEVIRGGIEQGHFRSIDAMDFAVTIAGISMFRVSVQPQVKRSLSLDLLDPDHLEEFRQMLIQITRQLLRVPDQRGTRVKVT